VCRTLGAEGVWPYKFVPAAISVTAGTTVTWTNHDDFTHNVTLADGTAPMTMSPASSVRHTLSTAGIHPEMCSLHPKDMKGSVLVTVG
jgi:plastocyanin